MQYKFLTQSQKQLQKDINILLSFCNFCFLEVEKVLAFFFLLFAHLKFPLFHHVQQAFNVAAIR